MKNVMLKGILAMLLVGLAFGSALAQITYRVSYDAPNQTYRVYMTSATSYTGNAARLATAQVTLLFPHATGSNQFVITNLHGKVVPKAGQSIEMVWDYSSRANAPTEDPTVDFQSFGYTNSSGLLFDIPANQEIELFSFQNSGPCLGPVRLITNTEPFAAHIPNSVGGTAGNAMYIFATQNTNIYSGNYGTAASCGTTPDLTVGVTGPSTLTAGMATSYSVNVSNVGGAATTGPISVTTLLPPGLVYSTSSGAGWSCTSSPSGSNTQVVCSSSGPISASAISSYSLLLTGAPAVATATFSALVLGGGDLNLANNTTTKSVTVVQAAGSPDLSAALSGPASVSAGSPASYTLNLTNVGSGATTGTLTTTITLASGLTYNGASGAGWSVSSNVINGITVLTATSSAVLAGSGGTAAALVLNVTALANAGGTSVIINGIGSTPADANAANNAFTQTVNILGAPAGSPNLIATINGPASVSAGSSANYTVSVVNSGSAATTAATTTTITLAADLTYNSFTGAGWTVSSNPGAGGTTILAATYSLTIGVGSSVIPLILNVTPTNATIGTSLTINGLANTTGNAVAGGSAFSQSILVLAPVVASPALSFTLTCASSATVNVPGSYTLTVINTGNGTTTGPITTTISLPAGMTYANFVGIGWTVSSVIQGNGTTLLTAIYSLTVVPGGSPSPLIITITPTVTIAQSVTILGGGTTPGVIFGSSFSLVVTVQLVVPSTIFDLSAGLDGPTSLTSGVPANLTLILTNVASTSALVSPVTQTTLPAGMTLNGVTGIGWTISSTVVNGLTVVTATYSGTVAASTALPVLIFNVTAVNSLTSVVVFPVSGLLFATGDINPTNNFYNTPFTILGGSTGSTASLITTVLINNRAPNLYQAIITTIIVTNNGPGTAFGVVSQVTLPNGQPITSLTFTSGTSFNPGTGLWTIGTVQPGQSVTLTITMSAATGGIATIINSVTGTNASTASAQSCFSVPMDLCSGQTILTSIPASFTGVQWFKDGTLYATGNTLTINLPGTYTVQAPGICSSGDCCPVIVRASTNCCMQPACVPILITKTRTR